MILTQGEWLTRKEAEKYAGVFYTTLQEWQEKGYITTKKAGEKPNSPILIEKASLLGKTLQAGLDDLFHDIGRFAGVFLRQDGLLALQSCGRHAREIDRHRVSCRNMHRQHATEL